MVLSLRYGDLSGTISEVNKLANELDQYCNDLSRNVQQKMYSVEGGMSSALNSADYYVNQKISQLRTRETNARTLSSKSQALLETAKRVDEDVKKMIEANQTAFFNKNPELKAPWYQRAWNSFMCDVKNKSKALGTLISGGVDAVKQALAPLEELCRNIRDWLAEGGWKVALTVAIGVTVAVVLIISGGTLAVFGIGLLGGLIVQTVGDVFSGSTSSWQSYVGAGIGGALGAWACATGGAVLGGAVSSGVSTFVTKSLERFTGASDDSWLEITTETFISSVVGAIVSKVVGKATDALSKSAFVKKILQATRLEGKWDFESRVKGQLTKLANKTTKHVGWKTVKNVLISNAWDSIKAKAKKYITQTANQLVMDNLVRPYVEYAKGTEWLGPLFRWRITYPAPMKEGMDLVKNMFDIYQSMPNLKAA